MDTEIELSLSLAPEHNAAFAERVSRLLSGASAPRQQRLVSIYYDTPSLDLARQHIGLRLRRKGNQWIQTIKLAQQAGAGLNARTEIEHLTHGQALELQNIADLDVRAFLCHERIATRLQPVFVTTIERTIWDVTVRRQQQVELVLDVGSIDCDGRSLPVNEVEIELKQGDTAAVFDVARTLARSFSLLPQMRSKAERGYRLYHRTPTAPSGAKKPPLDADMSPQQARTRILLEGLRHLQANLIEIGRTDDDMEFIHQARVGLRRLRSAHKAFAALPDDPVWPALEADLQRLGQTLGHVRDCDVLLRETLPAIDAGLEGHIVLEPVRQAVDAQRTQYEQRLRKVLDAPRTGLLLIKLLQWLSLDAASSGPGPNAAAAAQLGEGAAALAADAKTVSLARPVSSDAVSPATPTQTDGRKATPRTQALKPFAAAALTKRARAVQRLAGKWSQLDDEQRHELRKLVKKLRYAVEFFAPLYASDKVKGYLGSLQALQEDLGLMNDAAVARHMMDQLARQRPAIAYHAGAVAGWQSATGAHAIADMTDALRALKNARPFW